MKTYTFKLKVDSDKIVFAVNMQLEQFFDSVCLTENLKELCERYPFAYITASDFYSGDNFMWIDRPISTLKTLLDSKDLKSYLLSKDFCGFCGEDSFNKDLSSLIESKASEFIEMEKKVVEDDEEVNDVELSEANKK